MKSNHSQILIILATSVIATVISASAYAFHPGTRLYWKLQGAVNDLPKNYDIYELDLDVIEKNTALVDQLKKQGKKVICYFSAGTYELDRKPNRYDKYYSGPKGKKMPGWDELWLDIRRTDVRAAQLEILKDAKKAGCDAIDPDNIDLSAQGDIGFESPVSIQDNISYLKWLAKEAHALNLKIGLKNSVEFIKFGNLHDEFDFSLNEQCFTFNECASLSEFIKKNKAAYVIEYKKTHESKAYKMSRFNKDCAYAKKHRIFFFVYKTQLVDGNFVKICE